MPDWSRLRETFTAGLDNGARLALIRKVEAWLDLPPANAEAALEQELANSSPRVLYGNLVALNFTLQREAGIAAGPEANAALQKLLAAVQQGSASEAACVAARRLGVVWQLGGILTRKDPAVTQPPSAGEIAKEQLQRAGTAIFGRLDAVQGQTLPGTVTAESIKAIASILESAKNLVAGAEPGNLALPQVLHMTGGTARTLAACYAIANRNEEALRTYVVAADYFSQAGEKVEAQDCNARAESLRQRLSGSLDAAAAQPLAALNRATPQSDPFTRIKALMDLVDVARDASDSFEAQEKAGDAAAQLTALGYRDPCTCAVDAAMDSWITAACANLRGLPMLARVSQAATWYDGILGARYGALIKKDGKAAAALSELKFQLQKLSSQAHEEARAAETEEMQALKRYYPGIIVPSPESGGPAGRTFQAFTEECRTIDDALAVIRQTCNQRAAAGEPMDDLLAALKPLQARADGLNRPDYEARTRLEEAYVLYHLGRGADLIPVAQDARRRLLAGRPATLSSMPEAHQRYLYLDSLDRELMGRIMTGELATGLDLAEATIRDYEGERYRISSEYRQSAMLSYVASFYTWAAFCALKLEKWDNMLEAIDLIKARLATRSRLIPDAPESLESDVAREFERLSNLPPDQAQMADNEARRRELWDLLSIARAQTAASVEMPVLTKAALQRALAEDETMIAYFWLHETVILTVAIDRERFHAERIVLSPPQIEALKEFVSFVQQLKSSHNMDRPIAKLGEFLLPAFLRGFMSTAKRILFSPHHSLHLFPFHAARWDETDFVGTKFAVRYVPNFSSILLPWNRQPENRVLAIGIRDFADPAVRSLPNVEDDVHAIQPFYEAGGHAIQTMLGKEATRERIESLRQSGELAKFRCVHLGTHGLSVFETPNQPLESRLLMQNGALDAMDIANLRLNAELVVMAACHSGQRAIQIRDLGDLPGDDIFGLQSALFKSGVLSMVGTLWLVETESSSAVMRAFHRHFAAGAPAEVALQQAVTEYLANTSVPRGVYYWAPYFVASLGSLQRGE